MEIVHFTPKSDNTNTWIMHVPLPSATYNAFTELIYITFLFCHIQSHNLVDKNILVA